MKKSLIFTVILGMLMFYASITEAAVVQYREYTLRVGETFGIEDYLDVEITLKSLQAVSTLSYPSQERKLATIAVYSAGGCNPNNPNVSDEPVPLSFPTDQPGAGTPRCVGRPVFENEYNVSEGQTIMALGLKIQVVSIADESVKIQVFVPGNEEPSPAPESSPMGPKLFIGGVTGGGSVTICPAGGSDCTVCSGVECSPRTIEARESGVVERRPPAGEPRALILSDNEEVQEVSRVEVTDNSAVYQIKTEREARLFFLIPVKMKIKYSVNSDTGEVVGVNRPWWNFLAR